MEIELKRKYLIKRSITSQPYSPRTGNSHGPQKDKLPARQPCKRASAGAKTFVPTPLRNMRLMTLVVDGLTGKRLFIETARYEATSSQADAALALAKLT